MLSSLGDPVRSAAEKPVSHLNASQSHEPTKNLLQAIILDIQLQLIVPSQARDDTKIVKMRIVGVRVQYVPA